jgi:3-oxoacyl-[acyl-carrier-protein] synthase III
VRDVYITGLGAFFPGPAVDNERIEQLLGLIHERPSRLKRRVLAQNGIKTRHYALDEHGHGTHQNEALAAAAIAAALRDAGREASDVDCLAVATSQADLMLPGFGSMVQAASGLPSCQLLQTSGICNAGVMALRAACAHVRLGDAKNALVCASELPSRSLKSSRYEAAFEPGEPLEWDAEFLRWMLSDGAGAWLIEPRPRARGSCFRIDWTRLKSYSSSYPLCMSAGRSIREGQPASWQDYPTCAAAERQGAFLMRQDMRLLDNVVKVGVELFLELIEEGLVAPRELDHVLCHYSSDHFRGKIFELLRLAGVMPDEERWFSNLESRGNTGSASIFVMLEELRRARRLEPGQKVLCMVPESGRFSAAYVQLTVVGPS